MALQVVISHAYTFHVAVILRWTSANVSPATVCVCFASRLDGVEMLCRSHNDDDDDVLLSFVDSFAGETETGLMWKN